MLTLYHNYIVNANEMLMNCTANTDEYKIMPFLWYKLNKSGYKNFYATLKNPANKQIIVMLWYMWTFPYRVLSRNFHIPLYKDLFFRINFLVLIQLIQQY